MSFSFDVVQKTNKVDQEARRSGLRPVVGSGLESCLGLSSPARSKIGDADQGGGDVPML